MKRLWRAWPVRWTVGFAATTSLRMLSTILHMTTLERIYKPRDFRRTSYLEISPEIIDALPKYCHTVYGLKMDPINLIFVGTESGIKRAFEKAGWHSAHPSTPIHILVGLLSGIFQRSYKRGPFMPLFTGIGLQDMGFQKTTKKNRFSERHHVRIWRTRYTLPGDNTIWVAAATHETGLKVVWLPPFVVHKMNPDLDYERDFIAGELIDQGHLLGEDQRINNEITPLKMKRNPNNDPYFADGLAKVIEIS